MIDPKVMLSGLLSLILIVTACGQASEGPSEGVGTGGYRARLVFPDAVQRPAAGDDPSGGVDCAAGGISAIEFNFILDGQPYGPYIYACTVHKALISGVPAGEGIEVEVSADDVGGNGLYEGFEVVDIVGGQVTVGGEIRMQAVAPSTEPDTVADSDGDTESDTASEADGDTEPDTPADTDNGTDSDSNAATAPGRFSNEFGMEFVRIYAAGDPFTMGSPIGENGRGDNETEHEVTLSGDYYMQETEVTQGQWRAVWDAAAAMGISIAPGRNPSYFVNCGENCPVEQVSWEDIRQFIEALNALDPERGYRLPREAEWEYAARGGGQGALPNGELTVTDCGLDDNLDRIAWYCGNSDVRDYTGCSERSDGRCIGPHAVREKEPNVYGLYDMHGNIWEWCQDWYGDYPAGSVTDPPGPSSGALRVLRGGSWGHDAYFCRSADRSRNYPGSRISSGGFRLAASLVSR